MGIALIRALSTHPTLELAACGIRAGSETLSASHFERAGLGFACDLMVDTTAALVERCDAMIDFTSPDYTVGLAGLSALKNKILISGTTGLSAHQKEALIRAGESTRVVWSANMSLGVALLQSLVEQAAATLDVQSDIEIIETHHRMKQDAPSGTALALGEAAARGRGVNLHDVAVRSRDGITGARKEGTIGFSAIRGGDVVGDHTVLFAAMGERLELTHKASSRDIYARGALKAAQWVSSKPNGFYTMRDMVG